MCDRKWCRLERCYYAFPKSAPEDWSPAEHLQKKATENLKKTDVSEKVNQARTKKAKTSKPDTDKEED